jgi:hypothetical protein
MLTKPQVIHRKRAAKRFFGDPPDSTWHDWIKRGLVPEPDVELGPQTPGWTEGLIARHQATRIKPAKG